MDKVKALKILRMVPLSSGYAYDLIQHFIDYGCEDEYALVELEAIPNSVEAGDLFRTLVLDEHFDVDAAEEVYDAAMVIVRCADSVNQKVA